MRAIAAAKTSGHRLQNRLFPRRLDAADLGLDDPPRSEIEEQEWIESLLRLGVGQSQSCLSTMEVQLLGSDRQWRTGRVEGLSPWDLLADIEQPVLIGELVAVRLHSPFHRLTTNSLGIVHWRQRYLGRYLIGLFLRDPLPARLLSEYWMDVRTELRYPARKSIRANFGSDWGNFPVTVMNYSHSGVCLLSEFAPQVSQPIELYEKNLLASGIVRYVRRDACGRGYQFGCAIGRNQGVQIARAIQEHEAGGYEFWMQAPESSPLDYTDECFHERTQSMIEIPVE